MDEIKDPELRALCATYVVELLDEFLDRNCDKCTAKDILTDLRAMKRAQELLIPEE